MKKWRDKREKVGRRRMWHYLCTLSQYEMLNYWQDNIDLLGHFDGVASRLRFLQLWNNKLRVHEMDE